MNRKGKAVRAGVAMLGVSAGALVEGQAALAQPPLPAANDPGVQSAVSQVAAEQGISMAQARTNLARQVAAGDINGSMEKALGAHYAGLWFDHDTGQFKVGAVAGANSAAVSGAARAHGVADYVQMVPVRSSWNELLAAKKRLYHQLGSDFAAQEAILSLDPTTNAVVVELSSDLPAAEIARLRGLAAAESVNVRVEVKAPSHFRVNAAVCNSARYCDRPIRGGTTIVGAGSRCTDGFLARSRSDNKPYVLTAGHCLHGNTLHSTPWYATDAANNVQYAIGPAWNAKQDSEGDAGIIQIASTSHWYSPKAPEIVRWANPTTEHVTIHSTGEPYVGLNQCHEGSTSGKQCGTDQAENVSVAIAYESGTITVNHLSQNSACSSPGDSGGPWEANNVAYGIDLAGRGCPTGPSFYEPISREQNQMNVNVQTG